MPSAAAPAPSPACCPRCGRDFVCGASGPRCDCFTLSVSPALRADLAQRYTGCLCLDCLRALAQAEETPPCPAAARC